MVAACGYLSAMKLLSSRYAQAIFEFLDCRSHRAQVFCDDGNAVRFLHAQLACVAYLDSIFRVRRDGGKHRQLINEGGRLCSAELCSSKAAMLNLHGSD